MRLAVGAIIVSLALVASRARAAPRAPLVVLRETHGEEMSGDAPSFVLGRVPLDVEIGSAQLPVGVAEPV